MTSYESYVPDKWVVVEITNGTTKLRKVLAGWYGGYTGSDSWKLSSDINTITEFDDRYEFQNESGSTYICYKTRYGMTGLTASLYDSWQNRGIGLEIIEEYGT